MQNANEVAIIKYTKLHSFDMRKNRGSLTGIPLGHYDSSFISGDVQPHTGHLQVLILSFL